MIMLPRLNTGKSQSDWYKPNKPKPIAENAMQDPDKKTWGFTIQTDRQWDVWPRDIWPADNRPTDFLTDRTFDRQTFSRYKIGRH